MMPEQSPVITIDGPSGTGKGTISQRVAQALGWHFLDSGALYRVLAVAAKQHAVDLDNENALEVLAAYLDVQFVAKAIGKNPQIILEGTDMTDAIRTEEVASMASQVAQLPAVRSALLDRQRAFRDEPGLVADGRDMGTVVFPDAELKIFLDASFEERAKRRYKQLKEKGLTVNLAQISDEVSQRDERDLKRRVAPTKPAKDALLIDTTDLSIDGVFQRIMKAVENRFANKLAEV